MMIRFILIAALLSFAIPVAAQPKASASTVRVVLVGDSTVTSDSGWGLGFKEAATTHNDQPGKGPDRETDAATTFRDNLARYVTEARAADVDTTHLNAAGSRLFARLVVRELREVVPALGALLTPE